ncbi:unnamed protein product [Echinostoma caproni]|uniref:Uncharacterized protein n=1 Tax=Echinostoma caproni TaxID=27848 RepID=A0A183BEZ7_9TREM|nr:unnamed protein product [Echinostoma caproni]
MTACARTHVATTTLPGRTEPSSSLHYATLDFSPSTPDRAHSSVDLRGTEPIVCTQCSNEYCVHESGNPSEGRSTVCPMRVYGTFVHGPAVNPNNSGQRARSLSSSGAPPTVCPSSMGTTDSELPVNYVAICQLQTLAMRAVLNATT